MDYTLHDKKKLQDLFDKHGEPSTINGIGNFILKACGDKLVGLQLDMRFIESVSNTHHAPIGKPRNWHSNPELPKGYPGYYGRIWLRASDTVPHNAFHCSDMLSSSSCAIGNIGDGGYGPYGGMWENVYNTAYRLQRKNIEAKSPRCYSYDYRIFVEDFPSLWAQYLTDCLAGEITTKSFTFAWTDPITMEQDQQLLQKWQDYNTLALNEQIQIDL